MREFLGASVNGCLKLQTYFELCQCGGDCKNQSCEDDGSHDSGPTVVEVCLKIFEAEPEDTEQLIVHKLPFEEVYLMVCNGGITDAMTVAAVLKLKLLIIENKL